MAGKPNFNDETKPHTQATIEESITDEHISNSGASDEKHRKQPDERPSHSQKYFIHPNAKEHFTKMLEAQQKHWDDTGLHLGWYIVLFYIVLIIVSVVLSYYGFLARGRMAAWYWANSTSVPKKRMSIMRYFVWNVIDALTGGWFFIIHYFTAPSSDYKAAPGVMPPSDVYKPFRPHA